MAQLTTGQCHFFTGAASSRRMSTKRDLSQSDVGTRLMNRKSWVSSLPPALLPLIADLKV